MKKNMIIMLVAAYLATMTSCSKYAPSCSDKDTIKLVEEIVDDRFTSLYGTEKAKLLVYEITAVRTQNSNDQTGAQSCAALMELMSAESGETTKIPFTYSVEKTDKRGEFYVEVNGL